MPESFGARLRRHREEQQIALTTIAEQTKIKASLLEALERDDVSHWPSGIFRRAFIRAYAHSVGLDPDVIVNEFLELYPDPIEVATAFPAESSPDRAGAAGGPPTRLRYLVGSAIESLSRLRRGHPAEDQVGAERPIVSAPAASDVETVFPAAADPAPAPVPVAPVDEVPVVSSPPSNTPRFEPDFLAVARLCTELGRVDSAKEIQPLLEEAGRILDAKGMIVWVWDELAAELRPALAHGYSDRVLAQLPTVKADASNLTAAAFRSAQTCAIEGSDHTTSALAVPLLTAGGCRGVLALELPGGSEQTPAVRAIAIIVAAQLAQLTGEARPAAVRDEPEVPAPHAGTFTPAMVRGTVRRLNRRP